MIPTSASGSGLTLPVAGFPTTIRPMFPILIALLGWYPGITPLRLVAWIVVAGGAVMWHELGHAFAARRLGASPRIELYGFGGATSWQPTDEPSRAQLIGVSFAGPFAGFVVGGLTMVGVVIAGTTGSGDVRYLVLILLWTNVGWGLVNLLPVLPLDGGHILAELLPGDRSTRVRRAAIVSIAVAGLAILAVISIGAVFAAFILGWVLLTNLSSLNRQRADDRRVAVENDAVEALRALGRHEATAIDDIERLLHELRPRSAGFRAAAIETAAATRNASAARRLLDAAGDEPLPPGAYALVFAVESDGRDGVGELVEIFRREPTPMHARWVGVGLYLGGRLASLPDVLGSAPGPLVPAVVDEAAAVADGLGAPGVADAVRATGRT